MSNVDFKPNWIKWDEAAFLVGCYKMKLNKIQRDMYRMLLLDCYFGDHRPYLLNDDNTLWIIAEADSLEHFRVNSARFMHKFTAFTAADGTALLSNKRVMEEWTELEKGMTQKKNAAASSVAKRRERGTFFTTKSERALNERSDERSENSTKETGAEQTRTDQTRKEQNRTEENRAFTGRSLSVPTLVQRSFAEKSNPAPLSSDAKPKTEGGQVGALVKVAKVTALETNDGVIFSKKGLAELRDAIETVNPSVEQLRTFVRRCVGKMEDFELKQCASYLASNMDAAVEVQIQEDTQRVRNEASIKAGIAAQQSALAARSEKIRAEEELAAKLGDNPF